MESVGAATWSHSVKSVRNGGVIAVCGATTGDATPAELTRIFFNEIRVQGVTMGTRADLAALANFVATTGLQPVIDSTFALADAKSAFERLITGDQVGKVVVTIP
jgi:NADPH:quinone reductase-like Zn-dependent oxidoreductase